VGFGRQVGVENQQKIDPKRHRKTEAKKKAIKSGKIGILRRLRPKKPMGYAAGRGNIGSHGGCAGASLGLE